jgi:hypothetical protein
LLHLKNLNREELFFQHDNAKPHIAEIASEKMTKMVLSLGAAFEQAHES